MLANAKSNSAHTPIFPTINKREEEPNLHRKRYSSNSYSHIFDAVVLLTTNHIILLINNSLRLRIKVPSIATDPN